MNRPLILPYGNDVKLKSFHINDINLESPTLEILSHHLVPQIWKNTQKIPEAKDILFKSHLSKIAVETECWGQNFDLVLHILNYKTLGRMKCPLQIRKNELPTHDALRRSFNWATTGELGRTRKKSTGQKFYINRCSGYSELETSPEAQISMSRILRSVDLLKIFSKESQPLGFENMEYYEPIVMLQKIFRASEDFTCIDYHHCPYTDSFLIHFHNIYGDGHVSRSWKVPLRTNVGFRDFLDFVYDEEYEWIVGEESKYAEMCDKEDTDVITRRGLEMDLERMIPSEIKQGTLEVDGKDVMNMEKFLFPPYLKTSIFSRKVFKNSEANYSFMGKLLM